MNNLNRQKFMTIFNDMLNGRAGSSLNQVLQMNAGNATKGDEVDSINNDKEQSMNMRLDQRNVLFLKKVAEAKQKILEGSYGECEECGEDISQKRLLARPTACFCIHCQEEKERDDFSNIHKRRDLGTKTIGDDNVGEHIKTRETFVSVKDISFESVVDL
jgi:DnaK suppressor protein